MPRGGPRGQEGFEDFFERYFGRPMPEAPQEFRGQSLGSGFILNGEGFILTNNHVVKDATDIQVMLSDGRQFVATVIGKDQLTDVALIKLKNPPKDLPTVVLGNSDALRQGDFVLALGSPLGLRDTATLGIVSAKHRSGINPGGTYDDFIQTDAAINPGNSGGSALQPPRRGGRHQHRHRPARRRAGHRLRRPDRPREVAPSAAPREGEGHARLPRRPGRRSHARPRAGLRVPARDEGRARAERGAARPGGEGRRPGRATSSSR